MSIPALRQPKCSLKSEKRQNELDLHLKFVIVTLKDGGKLVISSDSYHGVLMTGNMYKCVFCETVLELREDTKESHIQSASHGDIVKSYPHLEEFGCNLFRKLSSQDYYCTICNVVVLDSFINRHMVSEAHSEELQRAKQKASIYKAY